MQEEATGGGTAFWERGEGPDREIHIRVTCAFLNTAPPPFKNNCIGKTPREPVRTQAPDQSGEGPWARDRRDVSPTPGSVKAWWEQRVKSMGKGDVSTDMSFAGGNVFLVQSARQREDFIP